MLVQFLICIPFVINSLGALISKIIIFYSQKFYFALFQSSFVVFVSCFLLIISKSLFIPNVLYIDILNSISNHLSISNYLVLNFVLVTLTHSYVSCPCGKFQSLCYTQDISVNKTVKEPCSGGIWNANCHKERRIVTDQLVNLNLIWCRFLSVCKSGSVL